MHRSIKALVGLVLTFGLAGCFTSERSLISDSEAAAPYERITFQTEDDSEIITGLREGSAYVLQEQETDMALRFLDTGDDIYVVEVTGVDGGNIVRLFGALKIDFDAGTATAYKVMGEEQDVGPGLRQCNDNSVCIEDLDAYVALARAEIASGADPAGVYIITVK
jgi:hypothetical protein